MIAVAFFIISFLLRVYPLSAGIKPGAILGALTVTAVYLLIKRAKNERGEALARLTALVLAVNPWHILVSREFWQLDICLLAAVLGFLVFFRFCRNKRLEKGVAVLIGSALVGLVFSRYLASFSGQFLFFNGGWSFLNRVFSYQGAMYYLDIVFLLWGLSFLLSKERDTFENLILFWLLIAPWPAVFFPQAPLSIVSFGLVVPLSFLVAEGLERFNQFLKKKPNLVRKAAILALLSSYGFCLGRFFDLICFHRL
jgi:hypothetical protein